MRTIAEGLILREATAAEFRVFDGAGDVAISIYKIHCSRDADRSALGIDEDLCVLRSVIAHGQGLVEIIAERL